MERLQDLIDKLQRQQQNSEPADAMLTTVQQLEAALHLQIEKKRMEAISNSSKVAVVLPQRPTKTVVAKQATATAKGPLAATSPVVETSSLPQSPYAPKPLPEEPVAPKPIPEPVAKHASTPQPQEPVAGREVYTLHTPPAEATEDMQQSHDTFHHYFDLADEAPTLLQQEAPVKQQQELHELIGEVKESLNDRLKQQHTEVAHKIKEAPIKDLRKAIGVNDKFLFVNELFRGDEAMYERSLKTINGFHILPEAEYWMKRELKVKLGWNDNSEAARYFSQLVKRRFS